MTFDLYLELAGIVVLLFMSAFFSGSETALTAVSKARMYHLAQEGSQAARHVNVLIANREKMIGSILMGSTFVNILASSLATSVALTLFPDSGLGVAVATAAMTLIILIFSEMLPKTLAIAQTDRMALALGPPTRLLVIVLVPLVHLVHLIVWQILRLFGLRNTPAQPVLTVQEEIRGAIDLHHQEGHVEREHRNMLGAILDLNELAVSDVMVHRKNIEMVDGGGTAQEIVEQVLSSSYTRFPVWRDNPENIVGVLYAKDLLRDLIQNKGSVDRINITALVSKPWFVPETTTLEDQLDAFRNQRSRFALVVDEYGSLEGLITLEDILAEITGNIAEHSDRNQPEGIRPQADGSYNIDGTTPIRDLNRELDWDLPDEEATTIAGLVIHEAQTIPEVGQIFQFHGFKFEILRRQRNQITALRITPPRPESES
jgi:Mg2+/Co2+ transporter CorB